MTQSNSYGEKEGKGRQGVKERKMVREIERGWGQTSDEKLPMITDAGRGNRAK